MSEKALCNNCGNIIKEEPVIAHGEFSVFYKGNLTSVQFTDYFCLTCCDGETIKDRFLKTVQETNK